MDTKTLVGAGRVAAEEARLWGKPDFASLFADLCDAVEALRERVDSLEYSFGVTPNASGRAPEGPASSLTAPPHSAT